MRNICVFFGGKSCEHDISIITGVLTVNSINKEFYNPIPIFVDKDGKWYTGEILKDLNWYKDKNYKLLKEVSFFSGNNSLFMVSKNKIKFLCKIYSSINCLHGVNGEDGALSGVLKMSNIPNASPELFGSSFSMDKDFTKIVLSGINVLHLPYVRVFRKAFYEKKQTAFKMIEKKFGYPVIVKPATLGSSIGISTAKSQEELNESLKKAFLYDDKVIVEKALTNYVEINCGAYKFKEQIKVSNLEQPITQNDILSFKDKYLGGKGGILKNIPAKIDENLALKIKNITEKIYRKCDFKGVIRIDYLIFNGKIYVNEINTVPGSLAYYLFSDSISGFSKMLTELIEQSVYDFNYVEGRKYTYSSNILSNFNGVKGGKLKRLTKK